jgi:hypothetical protein
MATLPHGHCLRCRMARFEVDVCLILEWLQNTKTKSTLPPLWCQFHQRFMSSFCIRKCFAQLFLVTFWLWRTYESTFVQKNERVKRWWNWRFDRHIFEIVVEGLSTYKAFHRFWQAKFPDGGSVLGLSQSSLLYELPLKMTLNSKVVKIDSKIIIWLL